jgi:predicted Na+-dependent transporter
MLKKALAFYTKHFAVWVVLFGAAAYVRPGPFVALKGYMDWFFALKHFGEQAAMPAAIFVFICIITAALMAALWQRRVPD